MELPGSNWQKADPLFYPYCFIKFIFDHMKIAFQMIVLLLILSSCHKKNPVVVMETNLGDIHIELYAEQAPITANNFIRYIQENRHRGATFYRVVHDGNQDSSPVKIAVIQGGLYEDDHPQALPPIPHENTTETGVLHLDGVISMARYGPGTATFEFFICVGDQPALDHGGDRNPDNHGFAAFGRVIEGMEVVKIIHQQPEKDQFLEPRIPINNMSIRP